MKNKEFVKVISIANVFKRMVCDIETEKDSITLRWYLKSADDDGEEEMPSPYELARTIHERLVGYDDYIESNICLYFDDNFIQLTIFNTDAEPIKFIY